MSKEEIEKAKGWLSALDVNSEFEASSKEILLQYIEVLENKIHAKERVHEYDMDMIDEVKGRAVKLYKTIDEMAAYINGTDIDEDICKKIKNPPCKKDIEADCINCIAQYFIKEVEK